MIKLKRMVFPLKISLFILISTFTFSSTLKIGVVSDISYKTVKFIKDQGILKIEIIRFNNIENANKSLVKKDIDLNLFQTLDQLKNYNITNNTSLKNIAEVYSDPIGIYSKHHNSIKSLEVGELIVIPSGESNISRSLKLLSKMGLIEINSKNGLVTKEDIRKNFFNVKIVEVDSNILPRFLEFAGFVVLNGETALNVGYKPELDSLFLENSNLKYINVVAAREKTSKSTNKNIIKFVEAINSKEIKLFLVENFGDNISFSR